MKERPILFSAPMVRAILDGRKTQTRRIFKIRGPMGDLCEITSPQEELVKFDDGSFHYISTSAMSGPYPCPYGVPGDRLWVKESWRVGAKWDSTRPNEIPPRRLTVMYAAGGSRANNELGEWADEDWPKPDELPEWAGRQRPSIHMPRWASRITLEVSDVRVQRLDHVSASDVAAEGCELPRCAKCGYTRGDCHTHMDHNLCGEPTPPHEASVYHRLWDSINGAGSWIANPWVWVVEFRQFDSSKGIQHGT